MHALRFSCGTSMLQNKLPDDATDDGCEKSLGRKLIYVSELLPAVYGRVVFSGSGCNGKAVTRTEHGINYEAAVTL